MESVQRELVAVLVKRVYERGLIAEETYARAMELAYSATDLPDFFRESALSEREGAALEFTENPLSVERGENDF